MRKSNGIKQKTEKPCCVCNTVFKPFKSTQKTCSWDCEKKLQEQKPKKTIVYKPPRKVSKTQAVINAQYLVDRIKYLDQPENQVCFIDGCNAKATTVEHIKGRGHGYFDAWAEERGIRKTLDQRFWRPCCLHHNLELERNSELSKKYQLSKLHNGKKY